MNILSFDIEEWVLEKDFFGNKDSKYKEYDRLLGEILDKLDECQLKGTFFCVGRMATEFPHAVKLIADRGHDVGCHSNKHVWLTKLTREEAMEDTRIAVDALEQCCGQKILSYRAPAFSVGDKNKWVLEVLAECGIERDASIFPVARDFGGFEKFGQKMPSVIKYNGIRMKEFPICTVDVLGKEIAYSGGGYFRFFPLSFVEKEMNRTDYSMTYFHLGDLNPVIEGVMSPELFETYFQEKGSVMDRYMRYLKTNLGVKSSKKKLFRLLDVMPFVDLGQADNEIDWNNVPVIEL